MNSVSNYGRLLEAWLCLVLLLVLPGLGFVAVGSAQQPYEFLSLEVPNASGTLGLTGLAKINDEGAIVGGFAAGEAEGFLVSGGLAISRLGCPGASFTALRGLNNSGAISGSCYDGLNHGFFHAPGGPFVLIDVPDAVNTQATGLNDLNQVVGYFRDRTGGFHGFVWNGGIVTPFDLPGLQNVIPYPMAIDNRGQIVGGYAANPCNCNERGFLLSGSTLTTIDFPGAIGTLPAGINEKGQIVGSYTSGDERNHGFLLDNNGNFRTLDVPFPGSGLTEIQGINNNGSIVGRYFNVARQASLGFVANPRLPSTPPGPGDITMPAPGSTLTASTVTFRWSPGIGVSDYWFKVGSVVGGNDIFTQGTNGARSVTVDGLPTDGRILYVRLWSLINGDWQYKDYTYTAVTGG